MQDETRTNLYDKLLEEGKSGPTAEASPVITHAEEVFVKDTPATDSPTPSLFREILNSAISGGKVRGNGADMRKLLIVVLLGVGIALIPRPEVLTAQAWNLFALFVATIVGIVLTPLPLGAVAWAGLTVSILTEVLTPAQALSAFATGVPWLVAVAFFLSRAFIKSGLGNRLSCILIKYMGSTTLGLVYSLVLSEALIAPCIPSVAARLGGIVRPILSGISESCDSRPADGTRRRIGAYLVLTLYQTSCVSSAMFLTAMAGNPLTQSIAEANGVTITWGGWALGAIVPGSVCLLILPIVLFKLFPPEIKSSPGAPELARKQLHQMGPLREQEVVVLVALGITVCMWIAGGQLGLSDLASASVGLLILLLTGTLTWKDVLAEGPAWDTMMWFAVLISMADHLKKFGFTVWLADIVVSILDSAGVTGTSAMILIAILFVYTHYFFASASAHIGAMYSALLTVAISAGAPAMPTALLLAYFADIMGGLTHYGLSSAPPLFALGYVTLKEWWMFGLLCSVLNLTVFFTIGLPWFRVIGIM